VPIDGNGQVWTGFRRPSSPGHTRTCLETARPHIGSVTLDADLFRVGSDVSGAPLNSLMCPVTRSWQLSAPPTYEFSTPQIGFRMPLGRRLPIA
jgi:hypothetical protein